MRIYFGSSTTPDLGTQQSSPYVENSGNVTGFILNGDKNQELSLTPTITSPTLNSTQLASEIPTNLLNLISNPIDYTTWTTNIISTPAGEEANVSVQLGFESSAPEPSSWLVFLAAIGGGVIRYQKHRRR
jgi:hypothetical protein